MPDHMRWRYSDTNPVVAAVDAETVIEIGDLVYQDVDDAKPAGSLRPFLSPATGQDFFAEAFLGVAMQRSRAGETDPIRVATTGVFEFDCPQGTFRLGDLVGADWQGREGEEVTLLAQSVQPVPVPRLAIGRVAKRVPWPQPGTSVLVDIRSTVMTGGVLVR